MVDCIIIGSGVAGISAALTLQSNKKSCMIIGGSHLSDKITKAEKIHNYPGLTDITGVEFTQKLQAQLQAAGLTITQQKAIGIYPMQDKIGVATQEGGYFEAKTVILANGVESVKQIDGEMEFAGRGVSYCATCDGFLYKDKTIFALCTSKRLEHEIEHLSSFAKTVYAFLLYKDVGELPENVVLLKKMPKKIDGEQRVSKVIFDGEELAVDGVFVLKESSSPTSLLQDLEVQDGHIVVDRDMQTNVKGIFAAGDCTGRPYQYAKAVGEGNVAAHAVSRYLYHKL